MKIALITGGGRGIGAASAIQLASSGWNIGVNYRTNSEAAQTVVERCRAHGVNAIAIKADVSDEAQVIGMFETIDRELGQLTALVNNAAIAIGPHQRVDELSAERLHRVFAVNVIGSFMCARQAVLRMSTKHGGNGGCIVNLSSIAARFGSPGEYADYAASKAAIDTMTLGLSNEVAAEGIRVNSVRPGIIHTEFHASAGDSTRPARLADSIPMQRPGEPEEIANMIDWLCSDKASYVTGAVIDVSGGR